MWTVSTAVIAPAIAEEIHSVFCIELKGSGHCGKDSRNDGSVSRERHGGFLSLPFPCCMGTWRVSHIATFTSPHKREIRLLFPKLFCGFKDLQEVKLTPFLHGWWCLQGFLENKTENQTVFATSLAWQKVGSYSNTWTFRPNLPALQNWKAPSAVRAVSILECKITSHWKPNDFLQKSRKVTEGIQVGFYRWLFLSVQAKPVYPPHGFRILRRQFSKHGKI